MTYTKFHDIWRAADQLTGEALNHVEGQWAAAKADIDIHAHDSLYYTKTSADVTFFSTSFFTGFDTDKLDGLEFADIIANVMPIGTIMIWSGTDVAVPVGWHICDGGTYGGKVSPDLRNRFVIGAGLTYAVGETVGPATWNGTIPLTGTVTIGDHTLTTSELPAHAHSYAELSNARILAGGPGSVTGFNTQSNRQTNINEQVSGDGTHGHPGSTASITAIDPRPLYYSLYYIMKVS